MILFVLILTKYIFMDKCIQSVQEYLNMSIIINYLLYFYFYNAQYVLYNLSTL